jgi:hypothetical protein
MGQQPDLIARESAIYLPAFQTGETVRLRQHLSELRLERIALYHTAQLDKLYRGDAGFIDCLRECLCDVADRFIEARKYLGGNSTTAGLSICILQFF